MQTRGKVLGMFKRLVARKEYENEEKDAYLDQQNLKVNIQLNSCTRENPEVMMKFHEERYFSILCGLNLLYIIYNSVTN